MVKKTKSVQKPAKFEKIFLKSSTCGNSLVLENLNLDENNIEQLIEGIKSNETIVTKITMKSNQKN
jgi:precorrin isomerase